jgi:hypothetical protein
MGAAATVPAFDCDAQGIEIPETLNGAPFQSTDTQCDAPSMFEGVCLPHQKIVPIASTATATTVAICHRFTTPDPGYSGYDEIAVIQYDKVTGDTCFYDTTLTEPNGTPRPFGSIPSKAPAPSAGVGTTGTFPFWKTPTVLATSPGSQCIACHDNGPFIRSPYVMQVASSLPSSFVADLGFGNDAYNLTQPYHLVGGAFAAAGWRAVSITSGSSTCTSCHRMGTNTMKGSGTGTAAEMGPWAVGCYGNQAPNCAAYDTATDDLPAAQNPAAPHWMIPGSTAFTPAFLSAANQLQECALAWRTNPSSMPAGCAAQPITQEAPSCSARVTSRCNGDVVITCGAYPETLTLQRWYGTSSYQNVDTAPAGAIPTFTESPGTGSYSYRACSTEFPSLCSSVMNGSVAACKCSTPAQCCIQAGGTWTGKYCI